MKRSASVAQLPSPSGSSKTMKMASQGSAGQKPAKIQITGTVANPTTPLQLGRYSNPPWYTVGFQNYGFLFILIIFIVYLTFMIFLVEFIGFWKFILDYCRYTVDFNFPRHYTGRPITNTDTPPHLMAHSPASTTFDAHPYAKQQK